MPITDYSQNGEEAVLRAHFAGNRMGRFLDIGAHDGRCLSNTYALACQGWGGVCVEPSPKAFSGLMEIHGERKNIELVNAAVADAAGLAEFHDSNGDMVSTLSMDHRATWASIVKYRPILVS